MCDCRVHEYRIRTMECISIYMYNSVLCCVHVYMYYGNWMGGYIFSHYTVLQTMPLYMLVSVVRLICVSSLITRLRMFGAGVVTKYD